MFRFAADRVPVLLILALTAVDLLLYLTIDSLWILLAWFLVMLIPKGCICAWSHHHQHTRTFTWTPLNRLLELSHALHTGITTHQWLLHHVLGHHHTYLDQSRDQSRWQRRDGATMSELEYTLSIAATAYPRAWEVGRRYPKHLRTHLIYVAATLALLVTLIALRPMQGVILFLMPMIMGLLITAWATYDHHAGLHAEDDFSASYNTMNRLYNVMTGNLGYHTAHHHRQGVHWSELPALHEKIKDGIPAELFRRSSWDLLIHVPGLRGFLSAEPT
ncbi:MAG TPA: fatty acid desaturase [Pseudomonadales bacterium]|nr:fatty acid desaturase [Pseudomonadales bacterium]